MLKDLMKTLTWGAAPSVETAASHSRPRAFSLTKQGVERSLPTDIYATPPLALSRGDPGVLMQGRARSLGLGTRTVASCSRHLCSCQPRRNQSCPVRKSVWSRFRIRCVILAPSYPHESWREMGSEHGFFGPLVWLLNSG